MVEAFKRRGHEKNEQIISPKRNGIFGKLFKFEIFRILMVIFKCNTYIRNIKPVWGKAFNWGFQKVVMNPGDIKPDNLL